MFSIHAVCRKKHTFCYTNYTRTKFRVSTKAAIYNALGEVLVIDIPQIQAYGLPGGHIDDGEQPDDAMVRELWEECGLREVELHHKDFFMHADGKIVLAYTGRVVLPELDSQQNNLEGIPRWLPRHVFKTVAIDPAYREFVLANWPAE